MRCPECDVENREGTKFCYICGHKMSEAPVPASNNHTNELTPKGVSYSEKPVADKSSKPKRKKAPIIIGALLLLALVIAVSVFAYNYIREQAKTPEERLADAVFTMLESESGEINSTLQVKELNIDLSDSDAAMIGDLLSDLVVESLLRFDVNTRQIEGTLNLELMGTSLVTLSYYLDNEHIMLDIPLMYDQALYISIEDLVALVQGPFIENMIYGALGSYDSNAQSETPQALVSADQVEGAIDIVWGVLDKDQYSSYKAIDQTPYKELMVNYILSVVDEIEASEDNTRFHMHYDEEVTLQLMEDSLKRMSEDPLVMTFLEEVINQFFERIEEEQNYLLYAAVMEEDADTIRQWEGASFETQLEIKRQKIIEDLRGNLNDYEDAYDTAMGEASDQVDVDIESFKDSAEIVSVLVMDNEDIIVSQETVIDMDLSDITGEPSSVKIAVVNKNTAMNEAVAFKGLDSANGANIGDMDEEELMNLLMEIQNNLFENVMNNPMFSDLLNMGY